MSESNPEMQYPQILATQISQFGALNNPCNGFFMGENVHEYASHLYYNSNGIEIFTFVHFAAPYILITRDANTIEIMYKICNENRTIASFVNYDGIWKLTYWMDNNPYMGVCCIHYGNENDVDLDVDAPKKPNIVASDKRRKQRSKNRKLAFRQNG